MRIDQSGRSRAASISTSEVTLPLFLTRETKYFYAIVVGFLTLILYMSANHFPLIPPRELPLSWVDRMTPFMPNTVWIYASEYIFFFAAYIVGRDFENLNKYLYSFLALQIVSVMIFFVWPTTYPRGDFPLPQDLNALTYYLFSSLRHADAPTNCCPSLHVSSVFLTTFLFLDEQKGKFPFFFLWGSAIAISTLTTKQHYLIDVATGLMMAVLFYWVFHRLISYRWIAGKAPADGAQPNR